MNVVLVDDSDDDRMLFKLALRKIENSDQIRVLHEFVDGWDAVEWWSTLPPEQRGMVDVLLLDLKMPKLNGFDVLKWFLDNRTIPKPFIIVHSSSDLPEDVERAMKLGADLFVCKPTQFDDFASVFQKLKRGYDNT